MAQKYPDAYIINPIDHSGKINNDEFLMNCGGLTADRSDDRKNFMQTNPRIRFLIIGMGLMSSGKSYGFQQARNYCSLLNSTAARLPWATVDSGLTSHDHNIVSFGGYKKQIRNLFLSKKYRAWSPWTEAGWNSMSVKLRTQFAQDMYNIYYTVRHGTRITEKDRPTKSPFADTNTAENRRKSMTRELNLKLETPGESRRNRKFRLQREFKEQQTKLGRVKGRFSAEQRKKLENLKVAGGSATTYRNIRQAILDGKNIEYEAIGTSFNTIKTMFEVILESTKNCTENYTYIVLGVLNLCSIQASFDRQLCRFFHDSEWFIQALKQGNSWNTTLPYQALDQHAVGQQQKEIIRNANAPRLSLTTTTQALNQNLYRNMLQLITTCNEASEMAPTIYHGACVGFGIDILLISHTPNLDTHRGNDTDTVIATLPLSTRSRYIMKSTDDKSIQNRKFYHNLIVYILGNLIKINPYGKHPQLQTPVHCSKIYNPDENAINAIINDFIRQKKQGGVLQQKRIKELSAIRKLGSQRVWKRSLRSVRQGGRKKRRKTRRKKHKSRKKIRKKKTRRKRH